MAKNGFWRYTATTLRRMPWLMAPVRILWRLRQAKFSAGVAGVVFNASGQVLLVEHVFHPYSPWGLPGGWLEYDENPAEALRRELREELQLPVSVGPVLLVEVDEGSHLDIAYLCEAISDVGRLSSELLDFRWVDPQQLPRLQAFHYRAIMQALNVIQSA